MRKPINTEIEPGDLVEVVSTDDKESKGYVGMVGTFDMEWNRDGKVSFTVLFDGDEFAYATEIKLYKKGN